MAEEITEPTVVFSMKIPVEGLNVKYSVVAVPEKTKCTMDPEWHMVDFEKDTISEKSYDTESLEGIMEAKQDQVLDVDVSKLKTKDECKKQLEYLRESIRYVQSEKANAPTSIEKLLYKSQEDELRKKRIEVRRRMMELNRATKK